MLDYKIDTFLMVCKWMNFTRAAEELHITQPAVSHHIHTLEEEFGAKLIAFQGKKPMLTEAGRTLLEAAVTMKHDGLLLREKLGQITKGTDSLTFGATLTVGQFAMAPPLIRFIQSHPKTRVRMVVADTKALLEQINAGEIDFAIVEGFFPKNEYDFRPFATEGFTAVTSPGYPFQKNAKRIEDLLGERLLVREAGSGTRNILEKYLEGRNLVLADFPNRVEVNNIDVLKALAVAGCGVSFLYEAAVHKELLEGTLQRVPLEDFQLTHDFTFLWRKNSVFSAHYLSLFQTLQGEGT